MEILLITTTMPILGIAVFGMLIVGFVVGRLWDRGK